MEKLYYIKTQGYVGNCVLWWRLKSQGYTTDLNKAQKYTNDEAFYICSGSGWTEKAYSFDSIENFKDGFFKTFHADHMPKPDISKKQ